MSYGTPTLASSLILALAALQAVAAIPAGHDDGQPGTTIEIRRGSGQALRQRSPQHLQEWALKERLRIKGKYAGQAVASSSQSGLNILKRQSGSENSGGSGGSGLSSHRSSSSSSRSSSRSRTSTRTSTRTSSGLAGSRTSNAIATTAYFPTTTTSTASPVIPTASTLGYENLTNYQYDLEYYAPVLVGTPPQQFNVILDTGSADFWLVDNNCTTEECSQVGTFAANLSSTCVDAQTPFTIRYGMGTASGGMWNDTVSLAGHSLPNQSFALCNAVSDQLIGGNASGIMGLGWPSLSASTALPYWYNLISELAATASTTNDSSANSSLPTSSTSAAADFDGFSFYLTRLINSTDASQAEFGGIFTLGTLSNVSYVAPINYIDIPAGSESYWVVPLTALSLNGTVLANLGTPNVAIDTGTTLIGGPEEVVQGLYEQIGGAYALDGDYEGYYTFPCNASIEIGFTFGNVTYNMTSVDLNLGVFSGDQCLGAFFDLTLSSGSAAVISWVVGGAFLKNVYSVYRYAPVASVGFAPLSPALLAAVGENQNATATSSHSTAAIPSLIIGGPSAPVNGSAISGSLLSPTRTANPPAVNDLAPVATSRQGLVGAAGPTRSLPTGTGIATIALLALISLFR